MKKPYSLKLKQAAEEIKEILRKHEITASIGLHDADGYGEYLIHLTAPYSCAYMYNDNEIRFYSKLKDFNGNKDAQIKQQTTTSNMLNILTTMTANNFMILEPLSKKFDKIVNAEHSKGKFYHGKNNKK